MSCLYDDPLEDGFDDAARDAWKDSYQPPEPDSMREWGESTPFGDMENPCRERTWYVMMFDQDKLDEVTDPRKANILNIGTIICTGYPKQTHEWQFLSDLAGLFGFDCAVMPKTVAEAYHHDPKRITYEQGHANIWTQLRLRGALLAKRRKDKK